LRGSDVSVLDGQTEKLTLIELAGIKTEAGNVIELGFELLTPHQA